MPPSTRSSILSTGWPFWARVAARSVSCITGSKPAVKKTDGRLSRSSSCGDASHRVGTVLVGALDGGLVVQVRLWLPRLGRAVVAVPRAREALLHLARRSVPRSVREGSRKLPGGEREKGALLDLASQRWIARLWRLRCTRGVLGRVWGDSLGSECLGSVVLSAESGWSPSFPIRAQ